MILCNVDIVQTVLGEYVCIYMEEVGPFPLCEKHENCLKKFRCGCGVQMCTCGVWVCKRGQSQNNIFLPRKNLGSASTTLQNTFLLVYSVLYIVIEINYHHYQFAPFKPNTAHIDQT